MNTTYFHVLFCSNKRTVKGLTWPEHPETFYDSRLICAPPTIKLAEDSSTKIPNLLNLETDDESESEPEAIGLCKMSQSRQLHESLLRTVHSIYNQKTLNTNTKSSLDPRLAHSIAHRTAFLLQTVFTRTALNRQSAVRVLKKFPEANEAADVDNVTSNWETVEMAAEQLIGQVALDQETFNNFSSRLDETFKK